MASLPRSCWALPLAISCALGSAGASGVYAAISVTETLLVDAPALADDTVLLYLDVIVNQVPTGHLLTVAMQDDRLHLWPEQLSRIGLLFEDLREQAAMPLDGIPDLEHRYDAEEQRLYLHAPAHRLGRSLQVHGVERTSVLRATASPGALLNYDLHLASTDAGDRQLIAITGLRAFARQHVLENTAISRLSSWGEDSAYVRLDTQWTWSDQERLLIFTAGDFISGALPWTRATRMGGIQLRRNYSLRPDMITQPLPAFFGEAALPSQVELFVEGSLFLSPDYEPQGHGGLSIHGGISMSLGAAVNGGAAMTRHRSGARSYDAYLRRGVPADGGTGWGIEVNDGRWGTRVHADIGHRGEFMQVEAGVDALPRSTMIYADASGSVIWMAESSRQLFLARNIDSGFALVSTNGIPDVPVLLENRHIGDTNQEGYYLLTNLGAYRGNNVAFDPLHLPADARFDDHRVIAVPADRAGTMVDFGIRRVRSALLLLHDGMGNPMTMGSRISREGQMMAVVGHDGQAYLEDLSAHNSFTLTTPTGSTCAIEFRLEDDAQGIPVIGPIACLQ